LRPDHIYFQPDPIVIDCIEFNSELRQLDVLDELSFLAMECDIRQAGWIGRHILERYGLTNGDHPPEGLLSFYKCYRATVHAKVAALCAEQHRSAPAALDWSLARQYVQLADTYAAGLGPPLLVVLRGPAGCGKSTLAAALSEALGLECLQTDAIRRGLFPALEGEAAGAAVYRDDNREKVYQELLRRAAQLMDQGFSLVLDGTFSRTRWLTAAIAAGISRHAATLVVDCRCPDETALKRIADRLHAGPTISEATPDAYRRQQQEFEPLPAGLPVCPLNTAHSLPALLAGVYRQLRTMLTA
jgi:predicted kinase